MKIIIFTFIIISSSILFSKDNPWIYSNYPKPTNNSYYLVSVGLGIASLGDYPTWYRQEHEETTSFKYAMFTQTSNEVYSGYSISGYSQNWDSRNPYSYNNYYEYNQTSYLFAYSYLKNILQFRGLFAFSYLKDLNNIFQFKGLFYGYDVGLTYTIYDYYPIGLSLKPLIAFFDADERSTIGLGGNLQVGLAFRNIMISLLMGIKWVGNDDFLFFEDIGNFDNNHLSINISYITF